MTRVLNREHFTPEGDTSTCDFSAVLNGPGVKTLREDAVGYLLSRSGAQWIRRLGDTWVRENDLGVTAVQVEGVFEATLFDKDCQVSWRRDQPDGTGHATQLNEKTVHDADPTDCPVLLDEHGVITLLWGVVRSGTGGQRWMALADPQVGVFSVPGVPDVIERGRIALRSREYVSGDRHGNVWVSHRRWIGIEQVGVE